MRSLEPIPERIETHSETAVVWNDDADFIKVDAEQNIHIIKEKVEELIERETSLYYKFGLFDGCLLGIVATIITYTYKDRAAVAFKELGSTIKGLLQRC